MDQPNVSTFKLPIPVPKFTPTIDFGHILTVLAILASFWIGWGEMHQRLTAIEKSVARFDSIVERVIALEVRVEEHHRSDQVLRPADCPCATAPYGPKESKEH